MKTIYMAKIAKDVMGKTVYHSIEFFENLEDANKYAGLLPNGIAESLENIDNQVSTYKLWEKGEMDTEKYKIEVILKKLTKNERKILGY